MTTDGPTLYGFQWGPMKVERCAEIDGVRCVRITTDTEALVIAVSPKGKSIRAWLNHERLEARGDD